MFRSSRAIILRFNSKTQWQMFLLTYGRHVCVPQKDTNMASPRQVSFAGCGLQVAGWNLIITGKPLALKIIDNPYSGQGFLHKVIGVFHRVSSVQSNTECQSYWCYTKDEIHHLLEADIELLVSLTWTLLASIVVGMLVPMTWKIFSAYLKGLSTYRRMAFFFLNYLFFVLEILTFFYYAN